MKFVKDDKREQRRIEKLLHKMAKAPHVAVGILQDEAVADNFSMVDLALVHEFGTRDGRIPQRSFIRSTCDAKRSEHIRLSDNLQSKIIEGKLTLRQALAQLGEVVEKDMVQTINQGIKPDIADSTKKTKIRSLKRQRKRLTGVGFKPLIETGRLKGSIKHEIRGAS